MFESLLIGLAFLGACSLVGLAGFAAFLWRENRELDEGGHEPLPRDTVIDWDGPNGG